MDGPQWRRPSRLRGPSGNVELDFPTTNPNVSVVNIPNARDQVAQASWITTNGWTNGWTVKDIRTLYNPQTDTMAVGVNFFGIAGDADGNGDPGVADPKTVASGGVDVAHLGGRESITVAIDTNHSGSPTIVAGVPADKSTAGTGLDGFNVAAYKNTGLGIAWSYGQTLTNHPGTLAFDPSKDHPGFEFTITNFSKLPGLNMSKGFWIEAFAGSPDDVVAGEDFINWTNVPTPAGQVVVGPEPSTLAAWSLVSWAQPGALVDGAIPWPELRPSVRDITLLLRKRAPDPSGARLEHRFMHDSDFASFRPLLERPSTSSPFPAKLLQINRLQPPLDGTLLGPLTGIHGQLNRAANSSRDSGADHRLAPWHWQYGREPS